MGNIFPRWSNTVPVKAVAALLLLGGGVTAGINYYSTPKYLRVGYQPTQPVHYDHSFHAGELGLDCRYCHHGVDKSAHAGVPSANVCMTCHKSVMPNSPALKPIRDSYFGEDTNKDGKLGEGEDKDGDGKITQGLPVPWVRIHKAPEYVYFNHAIHVNRGVSCVECHGRVDQMKEVRHEKHLSMAFCLECHRHPENALRPMGKVTDLSWVASGSGDVDPSAIQAHAGLNLKKKWGVNPPLSCTGCHR